MEPFRLGMALRGAYLTLHRRANAALSAFHITADQMVVLTLLAEEDGITQQDLVKRIYSDPNTITAMLRLLEDRGFISRRPHATDGRARCIDLTPQGRELQRQTKECLADMHTSFVDLFSPREAEKLLAMLEQISKGWQPVKPQEIPNP